MRHTETRSSAAPDCGNSDEKAHYGLGISRSEERGVECKQDWSTEEGYLPSLKKQISAVDQLTVEQKDESLWLGWLLGAEVEFRLNRWSQAANN